MPNDLVIELGRSCADSAPWHGVAIDGGIERGQRQGTGAGIDASIAVV